MQFDKTFVDKPLWTTGFVTINLANLLVMVAVYMLFPLWGKGCRMCGDVMSHACTSFAYLTYAVGLFLPGAFCNYWLDSYKRKSVASWAVLVLLLCNVPEWLTLISPLQACVLRLIQGGTVAVFQIALGSTLLLDLTGSSRRTQAAHVYYWFTRFALSFGPLTYFLVMSYVDAATVIVVAAALIALSLLAVMGLKVPFRAPLEPSVLSTDRFWLGKAWMIFLVFLPVMVVTGLIMGMMLSLEFCACLMVGYALVLMLRHYMFCHNNVWGEVLTGMLFMGGACLFCWYAEALWVRIVTALCLGCGLGLVSSRFQLMFIRVTEHCERGTAQSTYMLTWESGLCLGLFAHGFLAGNGRFTVQLLAMALLAGTALFFVFYAHRWFVHHCCR